VNNFASIMKWDCAIAKNRQIPLTMGAPKISVLIPCFRQARFLPEALDSVLRQDFHDFEVIASDDASADHTYSILQDYAARDPRIRIFRQPSNLGMVANWNFCLRQARGEAVKLMGGDDRLDRTDCLTRQWQSLHSPKVALVACARKIIDLDSRFLQTLVNLPPEFFPAARIIPEMLVYQDNLIGEPVCCLFRRKDATRGFHPDYLQNTDIEMWFHLLRFGGLVYDDEPLVDFRKHPSQVSTQNTGSGLAVEEHQSLILKESRERGVSFAIRFRVLKRAQHILRYAPSPKIASGVADLKKELGPVTMSLVWIYYETQRTLKRWARSIDKRVPFLRKKS
jgi:glycosyltransferase involved in cell wall biosynthesis